MRTSKFSYSMLDDIPSSSTPMETSLNTSSFAGGSTVKEEILDENYDDEEIHTQGNLMLPSLPKTDHMSSSLPDKKAKKREKTKKEIEEEEREKMQ